MFAYYTHRRRHRQRFFSPYFCVWVCYPLIELNSNLLLPHRRRLLASSSTFFYLAPTHEDTAFRMWRRKITEPNSIWIVWSHVVHTHRLSYSTHTSPDLSMAVDENGVRNEEIENIKLHFRCLEDQMSTLARSHTSLSLPINTHTPNPLPFRLNCCFRWRHHCDSQEASFVPKILRRIYYFSIRKDKIHLRSNTLSRQFG